MMINLSNYDEYFLLYIDNELGKEECQAVEAFVHQHPHLAAELNMLQEAKLPPADSVVFSNKASLYKADNSINIQNYGEYFLLYTDKELTSTQKEEVEQFVLQHPQLQEEFLLLQSAKLVPENIECPDKQRLYKQPAKRVIPLYLTRIAVAAAISGAIVLIGSFLINNKGVQTQVAVNTPQNKPVEKATMPGKQTNIVLPGKKQNDIIVAKTEVKKREQAPEKAIKNTNGEPIIASSTRSSNKLIIASIDPLPATQQATIPAPEDIVAVNDHTPKHELATALKPLEEVKENEGITSVTYVSNDYAPAKPAVYKELNTEEDDQTLYVGALQLNKAKVNGLVKKVTHLLGGKNKESNL